MNFRLMRIKLLADQLSKEDIREIFDWISQAETTLKGIASTEDGQCTCCRGKGKVTGARDIDVYIPDYVDIQLKEITCPMCDGKGRGGQYHVSHKANAEFLLGRLIK